MFPLLRNRRGFLRMWKATTTIPQPVVQQTVDDDWDSDPNFVNNISEKDQRWGNQKTIEKEPKTESEDMSILRQKVIQSSDQKV